MRWSKVVIIALTLCAVAAGLAADRVCGQTQTIHPASPGASANEEWQKEFDEICSKTQDAMSYSVDELASLVRRCDALMTPLEKLDETRRKVYVKRLKNCRGLYAYVLESKKNEKK